MALYALDTNSVSYFLKGLGRVGSRLLAEPPSSVAVPSIVLYELEYGAGRAHAPASLRTRLTAFQQAVAVLPFGEPEARRAASIRLALEQAGSPIGPLDVLIAATALEHRVTLVTHNVGEFARIPGLALEDWY